MTSEEIKGLVNVVCNSGRKIRDITLIKTISSSEQELIEFKKAHGDEEFVIDEQPAEILRRELNDFGNEKGCEVEIVGEAFNPEDSVVGKGERKYIVHADVVDGTRETSHKVGLSYFEAGIMPWKKDPRLSDTEFGVVVAIGHDPITGELYSYLNEPQQRVFKVGDYGERLVVEPTTEEDFDSRGFFNTITSFRGTGILPVLKDRMFEEMYGKQKEPDVFHRETLTSCGELINLLRGSTRGVMDLRPAIGFIACRIGMASYTSPIGLCMHPYDVSGVWPLFRDTGRARIVFYDNEMNKLAPEDIPIRNVEMDIGYLACGNEVLFQKAKIALEKVLKL